jgi:hypothetical protein
MKIKTSELAGAALDWMVCVCEGESPSRYTQYSTDWAVSGPIIEEQEISIERISGALWIATRKEGPAVSESDGPTPLVAAMRCYVASQLGDEVDVPDELVDKLSTSV